jgi:NAD(P)-dependent dehydrogenase (short-subunit alcohol dehydrogenase family)
MSNVFRDNLFAGKVAFLTGGTSGIGLRIAERFAALGARVALMSRKQEKVDAAVAAIPGAIGFTGDVRNYRRRRSGPHANRRDRFPLLHRCRQFPRAALACRPTDSKP